MFRAHPRYVASSRNSGGLHANRDSAILGSSRYSRQILADGETLSWRSTQESIRCSLRRRRSQWEGGTLHPRHPCRRD